MKDRIKKVRTNASLSQAEFASKISVSRSAICKMESGENNPSTQTLSLICEKFNVSEKWLKEGIGEMYLPEQDDAAAYVSQLLFDVDDEFIGLIKGIMKTYNEFGEKEKEVFKSFAKRLRDNIKESQD